MSFRNKTYRFIWSICLLIGLSFSSLFIARATTPNPGHPWTGVGDGIFAITGPTILRTFTVPDADATILTSLTTDFGGTNAAMTVCNTATCDTLSLATNTDADTVSIGDSLDTINLAATTLATTLTTTSSATFASSTAGSDLLALKPQSTGIAASFTGTLTSADLSAARTWTLPDTTGTIALTSDITGAAGWTDGGTDVTLVTSTDNVGIGGASLGKFSIDGDTDEIQLLVQGEATQSSNLVVFENSIGTDMFVVTGTGAGTLAGDIAVNGGDITSTSALTITPATGSNLNITLGTTGDFAVNTNQLYVDTATSFVGIGTATPGNKLTVQDTGSGSYIMGVHALSQTPWLAGFYNDTFSTTIPVFEYYGANTGDFTMGSPGNKNVQIYTNGYTNPRLTVTGAGNVGIGDDTPSEMFVVGSGDLFKVKSSGGMEVGGNTGITWNGGSASTALTTIGTPGSTGSLWINTSGFSGIWDSGLAITGSYAANFTTTNITAYGVKFAGYGADMVLSTTAGTTVQEMLRLTTGGSIAATLVGTNSATFASSVTNSDILAIKPQSASGAGTATGTITSADLTTGRTWTLPDATGTIALTSDIAGSGWTDGGTDVTLTTSTDNVGIGGASLGKLSVDGDTDEIQLLVQGNATQTNNLMVLEDSGGTDYFYVTGAGVLAQQSAATTSANATISATSLTSGTSLQVQGGGATMTASGEVIYADMGAATAGAGLLVATTGIYTGTGLVNIDATTATSGVGLLVTGDVSHTGFSGLVNVDTTDATTGTGLMVQNNALYTGGGLIQLSGDSISSGTGMNMSVTDLTTGTGLKINATGGSLAAGGELIYLDMGIATAGNGIVISDTAAYTGTGLIDLTASGMTTGTALRMTLGTSMTTGSALGITNGVYAHSATETGNLVNLSFASASSTTLTSPISNGLNVSATEQTSANVASITPFTQGMNIATTFNVSGGASSSGAKTLTALNIAAPTFSACTGGTNTCTWNGAVINAPATTANFTSTGLKIVANSLTTDVGETISMTGLTTGSGLRVTGGTSMANGGELLDLNMGAALSGAGVTITNTGAYTNPGSGLITMTANTSSAGTGIYISMTSLNNGTGVYVLGGGANMSANGNLFYADMGAATTGRGLYVTSSGAYAGGGLVQVIATALNTGTAQWIRADGLSSGTGLLIDGGGANMSTGKMIDLNMGAAANGTGLKISTSGVYTNVSGVGLIDINATAATTGTGIDLSMTGVTSGKGIWITGGSSMASSGALTLLDMGAATTGKAIYISTTGVYNSSLGIIEITADALTSGRVMNISTAGLTTGNVINITGSGANTTTSAEIINVGMGAAVSGTAFSALTSGVYTDLGGVVSISASNATTGTLLNLVATSITSTGEAIDIEGLTDAQTAIRTDGNIYIGFNTANARALCTSYTGSTGSGTVAYEVTDCASVPSADYAEMYPIDPGITYGDIVAVGTTPINTYGANTDGSIDYGTVLGTVTSLVKSTSEYQTNIIGIVSDNYGDFTSAGHNIDQANNPMPVALNGRVPVKISNSSAAISPGDYITTSTEAGMGMKATGAGTVVGKALESWIPNNGQATIIAFVEQGYINQSGSYLATVTTSPLTGLTSTPSGSDVLLGLDYSQPLSGDAALAANAGVFGLSGLVFEGSTDDTSETFIAITNPTTDRTITFPDATITVNAAGDLSGTTLAGTVITSSLTTVGALANGSIASGFGPISTDNAITTSADISTTGTGTITSAGLLTATSGINIGASDTTGALLVLDTKTDAGDPTGVNGAMYYNASMNKYRCYENGAWRNCLGGDTQLGKSSLTETTLSGTTSATANLIGTVSITPATPSGDVYVTLDFWTKSLSNTDQTVTAEIRTGNACNAGTLLDSESAALTSGNNSNGPSIFAAALVANAGASAQTYAICAYSSTASGASAGGMAVATVIDSGADLAEFYTTNDSTIEAGDVVAFDGSLKVGVKKTATAYQRDTLGIIATRPGVVMGGVDEEGVTALPVALSGRVPVKVVAENGPIEPGDLLTASSTPGVAMRATLQGRVIGQALSGFSGEGVGTVLVFVNNSYAPEAPLVAGVTDVAANTTATGPAAGGSTVTSTPTTAPTFVTTEELAAAIETANTTVTAAILTQAETQLAINNTLTAGLDALNSRLTAVETSVSANTSAISDLTSRLIALETNPMALTSLDLPGALSVAGSTTLTGGLQVDSISSIGSKLNILSDLAVIGRPYFNKDTGGFAVIHNGDTFVRVTFEKPYDVVPVVQASVTFNKIADEIAASLDEANYFSSGIQSVVSRKDVTGFTIMLNAPATADLTFNWVALAITDARTDESFTTVAAPAPAPTPVVAGTTDTTATETVTADTAAAPIEPAPADATTPAPIDTTATDTTVIDTTTVPTDTTTSTPVDTTTTVTDTTTTTTATTDPATTIEPAPAPVSEPAPAPAPEPAPAP